MRGVNKVILVGNLGADPEARESPSGMSVAKLRMATSRSWKDKRTGERREATEWHSVALFGQLAQTAAQYLRKGSRVYIEGELRTRKWNDKDGQERRSTEVVVDGFRGELVMLGDQAGAASRPPPAGVTETDLDDEIPF